MRPKSEESKPWIFPALCITQTPYTTSFKQSMRLVVLELQYPAHGYFWLATLHFTVTHPDESRIRECGFGS